MPAELIVALQEKPPIPEPDPPDPKIAHNEIANKIITRQPLIVLNLQKMHIQPVESSHKRFLIHPKPHPAQIRDLTPRGPIIQVRIGEENQS